MEPGVRVNFRIVLAGSAMAMASFALAQEQSLPSKQHSATEVAKPVETATAGTGESLGFIGRKLWFEMRRRLNLTTEEEERTQRDAERSYKLRIGSIKLEKPE